MKRMFILVMLSIILLISGCSMGGGSKYPSKKIDFLVPAKPGGGWDLTSRAMQKVLKDQKLVKQNITITNKPGGNGLVAWKYLQGQDAYHLSINSALLITNKLLGRTDLTYKNFTPLATITTAWEALAVPSDSPYKSAKALMAQLKKDPTSLTIGVFGLGNNAHLQFIEAAKTYGVDVTKLKFLAFGSGAKIVTQLVGHHIDAATIYASEGRDQYKAGKINMLAVASGQRMQDMPKVPTWKELGVDTSLGNWRGFMGPPNMTKEQIAYWDDVFGKMVKTDAWKKVLKNNNWTSYYKNSADTEKLIADQTKVYAQLVKLAGLNKK